MTLDRRRFIGMSAGALAAVGLRIDGSPRYSDNPFALGVASGDPGPGSVMLWTRVDPDPLNAAFRNGAVEVRWRVSTDEHMKRIVRRGTALAAPEWANTVHVEAGGLQPERWYWYQFEVGEGRNRVLSPVGRTRTLPPYNRVPGRLRFAFISCQRYDEGLYTAFEHLGTEDLDLVIHLGDYIYEGRSTPNAPRKHQPFETVTLDQYRQRYALYKLDPALQLAHQSFPWVVTSDDHEVDNNYASLIPEREADTDGFAARRAAAYQAYFEHLPFRPAQRPAGPDMPLYRTLNVGGLAAIQILDTRQYRSDQPCGDRVKPACPARLEASATMMGPAQEEWLISALRRSQARWNVLAQQVVVSRLDFEPGDGERYNMDAWDGYAAARDRLLGAIREMKLANPIVLTGDTHSNWVYDIKADFRDEKSPVIGTEFVGTSISSGGDGVDVLEREADLRAVNPHLKFANGQRGYVRCDVTPSQWLADYRVVSFVRRPGAPVATRASFVIEDGQPGANRA